jgi:hypothetical protein
MHSVPAAPGSDRPIMKLALGAPLGGGWGRCLLLQHIGVTRQAFQHLRFSLHAEISDQISVRSISQPAAIIKISLICSIKTFDAASQQPEH